MEGFLRYRFGGFIFGGAYTWRGLFSEFYSIRKHAVSMFFRLSWHFKRQKPVFLESIFIAKKLRTDYAYKLVNGIFTTGTNLD